MITLRRGGERHRERGARQEIWRSFDPQDRTDPLADGFGALEAFDEARLSPRGSLPRHQGPEVEVITYVREGALACEDSMGRSGIIPAGEFQRSVAGRGVRHGKLNASRADSAHVYEIWLRSWEAELEPTQEQRRFSVAQRRGGLCAIASPDGRRESLRIHQDALVYSALLDPGQHVAHQIRPGRRVWLHVLEGEVKVGDDVLNTGDGAGLSAERALSITAAEKTEILLLDLAGSPLRPGMAATAGGIAGAGLP